MKAELPDPRAFLSRVPSAERAILFHSSPEETDPYSVEIVFDKDEETRIRILWRLGDWKDLLLVDVSVTLPMAC